MRGPDGIRRQDLRVTLVTADEAVILMHYDVAMIRDTETFLTALEHGQATDYGDQYMRMIPQFDTGAAAYSWLIASLFVGQGGLAGPH
jgi:septum formation inhibitor-activating ATPase MinD